MVITGFYEFLLQRHQVNNKRRNSLGGLRHLNILILNEKYLSILVKLTVLAVVCPPPTKCLAVVCPPPTKHLAVVAFGFGGHLYPYSLQIASEAVNKQLTSSKFPIYPT